MVDYAQCLLGFFGNWARKSWGSCIAPWENPSSGCWGSDPSLTVLSCMRREGWWLVPLRDGWWICEFLCVGVNFGSLWQVLGLDWLGWWGWKASLVDKEAQGRRHSTEEEREPAFIRHLLLWQALWVITFNYYYAASHYSLPERKLGLWVVKMLKVLGTRSFQLWPTVLFNTFRARRLQVPSFLCLAFILRVNWAGWQTAFSNLYTGGWWDPFIWLLKASLIKGMIL